MTDTDALDYLAVVQKRFERPLPNRDPDRDIALRLLAALTAVLDPSDELIERIARLFFNEIHPSSMWPELASTAGDRYRNKARAVLVALTSEVSAALTGEAVTPDA